MKHNTGWYFCSQSNWDGDFFDCRSLVQVDEEDFENLILSVSIEPTRENNFSYTLKKIKPEVFDWLVDNIKDIKPGFKGWCCGNDDYNSRGESGSYSLFFCRRKDAINFIKTWSIYKKPTETFNQNTYVQKILDKKTNKLKCYKNLKR